MGGKSRQRFATVLDRAYREGAVRIKRRDGKVFVVRPEQKSRSPLDVDGINLQIDRAEILDFIVAGRGKRESTHPGEMLLEDYHPVHRS